MADLSGKVVLLADDDLGLAIELEERLTAAGAPVVGVRYRRGRPAICGGGPRICRCRRLPP